MTSTPDSEQSKSRFFAVQGGTVVIADQTIAVQNQARRKPQTVIDKKYQILGMLGEGGMGAVFKAHHLMLNKDVALKTFRNEDLTDEARIRFQREAQAIAKLNHKAIVQVFDFGLCEDGVPYYTMEYLLGQTLSDRVKKQGPLTVEQAIKLFNEVCHGLALAHSKGVIHRDLKPANIFIETVLSPQGKSENAKIVDFGIASLTGVDEEGQKLTGKGIVFGSPLYMSPEQALGQSINECADIYSLGCSLYEALTGHPPFEGMNALETIMMHQSQHIPTLSQGAGGKAFPPSLERTLATMLAKSPRQRQQSMEQVISELSAVNPAEVASVAGASEGGGNKFDTRNRSVYKPGDNQIVDQSNTEDFARKRRNINLIFAAAFFTLLCCGGLIYVCLTAPHPNAISQNHKSTVPAEKKSESSSESAGQLSGTVSGTQLDSDENLLTQRLPRREDCDTPTAGMSCRLAVTPAGKKYYIFTAPPGVDMGYFATSNGAFLGGKAPAVGTVHWPEDRPVEFFPNKKFLANPANLDIFPPGSIYLIDMSLCLSQYKDKYMMKHLTNLNWLTGINVGESELTDEDIAKLDGFKRLSGFDIKRSPVTGASMAKLKILRNLVYLQFCDCSDARRLLNALKKGNSLTQLYLYSRTLSHEDVKAISTFSNLRCLQLNKNPIDDDDLAVIARLPRLEQLQLETSTVKKSESVETVRKLRAHGLSYIKLSGEGMNPADRKAIKDMFAPGQAVFFCETMRAPESVDANEWKSLTDRVYRH